MTESLYYLIGKLQYDFGNVKGLGEYTISFHLSRKS